MSINQLLTYTYRDGATTTYNNNNNFLFVVFLDRHRCRINSKPPDFTISQLHQNKLTDLKLLHSTDRAPALQDNSSSQFASFIICVACFMSRAYMYRVKTLTDETYSTGLHWRCTVHYIGIYICSKSAPHCSVSTMSVPISEQQSLNWLGLQ